MWTACFRIVLLPRRQVIAEHFSLSEAVAFLRGYHEVVDCQQGEAVIASEHATELRESQFPCPRGSSTPARCATRKNAARRKRLTQVRMA